MKSSISVNAQAIKKHGEWRNWLLAYVLIAPLMVWLAFTIFIPVILVFYGSFYDTRIVGTYGAFVGLDNYLSVLRDPAYWAAWRRSFQWILGCMILQTILGFSLALLLNSTSGRLGEVARTWAIVAWIIPTAVVALIWRWIFNGSFGIFNEILLTLNIISSPIALLAHRDTALLTAVFINVWRWFAFTGVIILAGLSTIPKELYESASVDGANVMQKFFRITMPSLQNITFTLGVVGTLWIFNIFDQIWLLTLGGPLDFTTTVPIYLFRGAFRDFRLGRISAASIITALILFVIALLLIRLTRPRED